MNDTHATYNHNTELFFCKWEENEKNDDVRIKLLDDFINFPELRLSLFKRKQEFLICLNQCISSDNILLYQKGIIILSDLIDIDVVNGNELLSLAPMIKALMCLEPRIIDEESHYTMIRQVSALNVIWKLDRLEFQWNDEWVDTIRKSRGLQSIVGFLEQNHQQGYKAQATQFLGMILEHGELIPDIEKLGVVSHLKLLIKHPNKIVKQNAIEALEMLYDDGEGEDSEYTEN